jgi:hypothetical protein
LQAAFQKWRGHLIDKQGDSFFVAFERATDAIACAAEAQQSLSRHAWPGEVSVRVRMGLHTGEPWRSEEGYVGIDVHQAACIAHVAHGGQVLLSETTTALVKNELPNGASLCDLGRHLLKDIHHPERIWQLVIEGLQAEFPPLTSLERLPAEGARLPCQGGSVSVPRPGCLPRGGCSLLLWTGKVYRCPGECYPPQEAGGGDRGLFRLWQVLGVVCRAERN